MKMASGVTLAAAVVCLCVRGVRDRVGASAGSVETSGRVRPTSIDYRDGGSPEAPRFEEGTQIFDNADRTWNTALADLDGDGRVDLVLTSLGAPARVLFNDGTGQFDDSGQRLASGTHGVATRDLDADGDVDLVFATLGRGAPSAIYLNDGRGRFSRAASPASLGSNERVALIDLDVDGDLDAYLWYTARVYVNDGSGGFALSDRRLPVAPEFGDLNGDGAVDVLSLVRGQGFRVYLNDGAGALTEHHFLPRPDLRMGYVDFADLDGDGDVDVVFTSGDESAADSAGVLLNDGAGGLSDGGMRLSPTTYGFVCTGDLNADGWVDVVLTDRERPPRVWLNRNGRSFVVAPAALGTGGLWNNCTIADLDNDGDLDVFVTRVFRGNHGVWFNRWVEDHNGARPSRRSRDPGGQDATLERGVAYRAQPAPERP